MCPRRSLSNLVTLISVLTPYAAAGFELQCRWNNVQIKKHFISPMLASSLSWPPGDQEEVKFNLTLCTRFGCILTELYY